MKKIVPCDVCIKRFYRGYVSVDENADSEEISHAMKSIILKGQDAELTEDPDLDIEDHDIVFIQPREDDGWTEEEDQDMDAVISSPPKITSRRVLFDTSVRGMCIKYHWYTCGTNEEYMAMLRKVEHQYRADDKFLYEIAKDIMSHSHMVNDETIGGVMSELALHSRMIYTIEEEE